MMKKTVLILFVTLLAGYAASAQQNGKHHHHSGNGDNERAQNNRAVSQVESHRLDSLHHRNHPVEMKNRGVEGNEKSQRPINRRPTGDSLHPGQPQHFHKHQPHKTGND